MLPISDEEFCRVVVEVGDHEFEIHDLTDDENLIVIVSEFVEVGTYEEY